MEDKIEDIFYTDPDNIIGKNLVIKGDEFYHCFKVSRKKEGEIIGVTDGAGRQYICTVKKIFKDWAECFIDRVDFKPREIFCEISLIMSLIKGERFEWIIEKGVELGVLNIIPVITERTIPKESRNKLKRWNKIALSALKQSGGSILPEIKKVHSLNDAVMKVSDFDLKLIAYKSKNSKPISRILESYRFPGKPKIAVAVGPEGDFKYEEIELAKESGFIPVRLGERRLRSETAAIKILSILINSYG